jgi:hypothetical protein
VPASNKATMTEHFIRHGDQLTIAQFTEDPVYLEEPLIRTTDFVRNPLQNARRSEARDTGEEIPSWPRGYVPSYPLGTLHKEFSEEWGIPFQATQGGKATIYPEYLPVLRELMKAK